MTSPSGPIWDPENGEGGSYVQGRAPWFPRPRMEWTVHRSSWSLTAGTAVPSPYLYPQMPERGHRVRGIFLSQHHRGGHSLEGDERQGKNPERAMSLRRALGLLTEEARGKEGTRSEGMRDSHHPPPCPCEVLCCFLPHHSLQKERLFYESFESELPFRFMENEPSHPN